MRANSALRSRLEAKGDGRETKDEPKATGYPGQREASATAPTAAPGQGQGATAKSTATANLPQHERREAAPDQKPAPEAKDRDQTSTRRQTRLWTRRLFGSGIPWAWRSICCEFTFPQYQYCFSFTSAFQAVMADLDKYDILRRKDMELLCYLSLATAMGQRFPACDARTNCRKHALPPGRC